VCVCVKQTGVHTFLLVTFSNTNSVY